MKNVFLIGIALSVASTLSVADYRSEISADWTDAQIDVDGDDSGDATAVSGSAEFFFSPVKHNRIAPLREQAFVRRASSLALELSRLEVDPDGAESDDFDSASIDVRFVIPDAGFVFGFNALTSEDEDGDSDRTNGGGITLGYFVGPTTEIDLNLGRIDSGPETDLIGLAVKHLDRLPGQAGNISFSLSVTQFDLDSATADIDGQIYDLQAIWYPLVNVGLGIEYTDTNSDNDLLDSIEGWSAFAEYYINEKVSISLAYSSAEGDENDTNVMPNVIRDIEVTGITLAGKWRI